MSLAAYARADRIDEFLSVMRREGLDPPDEITPGNIARFSTNGKRSDTAGWCILFDDMAGGCYGDHRTGLNGTWQAQRERPKTPAEKAAFRKRVAEARAKAEAEQRERHQEAAQSAKVILKAATGDPASHPYTLAKRVPFGPLVRRGEWSQRDWPDALLVPLYDAEGTIWTIEAISEDGSKDFLSGGRKRGCFYPIGKVRGADTVLFGEGAATVAAAVEATGYPGVAAMDAGNLEPVAKAIRKINPNCRVIYLADNDIGNGTNTGVEVARKAAAAVSGCVAIPDLDERKCDWWDVWDSKGAEYVREAIEAAPSAPTDSFDKLNGDIDEATLDRLAALTAIGYDRVRVAEAERLGCRVSTLDAEVMRRRPRSTTTQDDSIFLADPEPWPDPVDGVELLAEIAATFGRYCILPDGAATALALWTLFTHAHDAMRISPVLGITSPAKRCGKTTVLSVLAALARRPLPAANITAAALFRATEKYTPTLLIDEADTFLRDNDELRGVLNSGHVRSMAKVIRTVGDDHDAQPFSTWAPKAIALIGRLPGTLADRAIVVPMRRKRPDERAAPLRLDQTDDLEPIRRRAARWAVEYLEATRQADPEIPDGLHDRAADNWRSLLMVAEVAGGAWPQRARKAALVLAAEAGDGDQAALLLGDIRDIFATWEHPHIPSASLVERLVAMEDRPWSEWRRGKPMTPAGLSRALARYGIVSRTIRLAATTAKGYPVETFEDAFSRYLSPHPSFQNVTPSQASIGAGCDGFENVTQDPNVTVSKTSQRSAGAGCDGVTVSHPPNGGNGAYTAYPTCPRCAGEGCSWCVDPATEAAL